MLSIRYLQSLGDSSLLLLVCVTHMVPPARPYKPPHFILWASTVATFMEVSTRKTTIMHRSGFSRLLPMQVSRVWPQERICVSSAHGCAVALFIHCVRSSASRGCGRVASCDRHDGGLEVPIMRFQHLQGDIDIGVRA